MPSRNGSTNTLRCCVWRAAICAGTGPAKRKQGPCLIASQSKIKDVKVMPHVSAVCRSCERQHPELESETIYYLGNRLVVAIGNFGHAWLQENLPISGK